MRIERSLEILCSPLVLWNFIDDPEKMKLWMKGLQEIVPDQEGPTQVGHTFQMKIKEGRRVAVYREEVLAYDPPRRVKVRMSGGSLPAGMHIDADYNLVNQGGSTRLDYVCTGHASGAAKLLAVIFRPITALQLRGFFKRLKKLAEEAQLDPTQR